MPIEPQTRPVSDAGNAAWPASPAYRWYHQASAMVLILFCMVGGTFLLVFPWWGDAWQDNYFSSLLPQGYWENSYLRGAISGLGVVNLYISFVEMLRLRRFFR